MTRTDEATRTSTRITSAPIAINSGIQALFHVVVVMRRGGGDDERRDPLDPHHLDPGARRDPVAVLVAAGRPGLAAHLHLAGLELGDRPYDHADPALHRVDARANDRRAAGRPPERRPRER